MDLTPITLPTTDETPLAFAGYRGRRVVLVLSNQLTRDMVPEIARQLHGTPATAGVPVLQVAHLVGVPRMVRKLAERDVRRGLAAQRNTLREQRVAHGLPPDDANSLVTVGLDWDGEVTGPLGFTSADTRPLVAVVDERGVVMGNVSEPEPVAALVALLRNES